MRRVSGPAGPGLHRVAWDLRYPAVNPTRLEEPSREAWDWAPQGPLVVPGTFSVTLDRRAGGTLTRLAGPRTFEIEALGLATIPEKDRGALLAFQKKAGELQRAMMGAGAAAGEALRGLKIMKKALADTPRADPKLLERLVALEGRLQDALVKLYGDSIAGRRSEATSPGLMDRVGAELRSTSPATATVKRDYEIAAEAFGPLLEELRTAIEVDLRKLGDELEAAGAPWTPGRGVPVWKKN